jgi:hypothetical protein
VVGEEEERAFRSGWDSSYAAPASTAVETQSQSEAAPAPDLATLLQWMKEGKQEQVVAHLDQFSVELKPLIDLMLQQGRQ